jgi:integrase
MSKAQIKKFAKWLREEGSTKKIRETSIKVYCESLNIMVRNYGLDINSDKPNIKAVVRALNEGKTKSGEPLSAATLKLRKATLKYWLKYKGGTMTESVTALLKTKSGDRRRQIRPKDLLTLVDVEDIIENTTSQCLRSLIACLWDLGCRPSEITGINIEDVVPDDLGFVITIRRGKSSEGREVRLLTPMANSHLKKWMEQRPDTNNPSLFLTNRGKRYQAKALTSWLVAHHQPRQRARRKMPKWHLSPYLFRKSRTTQLLKEKRLTDIEIKLRLGHKMHSNVLETYYAILDEQDQAKAEKRYVDPNGERNDYDVFCSRCRLPNETDAKHCIRCGMPLTEEGIVKLGKSEGERLTQLEDMFSVLVQAVQAGIKEDDVPVPVSALKGAIEQYTKKKGLSSKTKKRQKKKATKEAR